MTKDILVYEGPERRSDPPHLTEEQIEEIAEKAAEVALQKVYTEIGKSVVKKFLWVVGAAAMSVYMYFKGKGVI